MHAYHLYSSQTAFIALALVTLATMTLAVRHDALPIALLALVGGLATPPMISTGGGERDALCIYLAILDLGVLGVAFVRRWPLDVVAAAGTWLLLSAFFGDHADPAVPALAWTALFFAIFALTPFAYHLRRRVPLDAGRFVAAIGNALVAFALAGHLLDLERHPVGHVALVLAAAYLALGVLARRRLPDDARAFAGFLALAVSFLTVALALHFRASAMTAAFAIEAPVLLYLGRRYRARVVELGALLVLGLALVRFVVDLEADAPLLVTTLVPLSAAAAALLSPRDGHLRGALAVVATALAAIVAHVELWRAFDSHLFGAGAWIATALACVVPGRRAPLWRGTALAALLVAGFFVAAGYVDAYDGVLFVNLRFALAVAAIGTALLVDRKGAVDALAIFALWLALSAEVHAHIVHAQMALSITWSAFAIVLCAAGFRRRVRGLRLAGLGLFALTSVKLLVVDLAQLDQLYRVASFLALGLLMIAASWLYARSERRP